VLGMDSRRPAISNSFFRYAAPMTRHAESARTCDHARDQPCTSQSGNSSRRSSTSASTKTSRDASSGRARPTLRPVKIRPIFVLRFQAPAGINERGASRSCGGTPGPITRVTAIPPACWTVAAHAHVPKIFESFGATEFWTCACHRAGWYRREARHPAAAQRAPLLLPGTSTAGARVDSIWPAACRRLRAAAQPEPAVRHRTRAAGGVHRRVVNDVEPPAAATQTLRERLLVARKIRHRLPDHPVY